MEEISMIRRKIALKKQGVELIKEEIRDLQILLAFHKIKKHFEDEISQHLDPILSRKLDCINYLIEN